MNEIVLANGLVGSVLSDYFWALCVVWTTPLVATLGTSLTIPLAMVADMMIHGHHYSAVYISSYMVLLKMFSCEEGEMFDVQKLFGYAGIFTLVALWWLGLHFTAWHYQHGPQPLCLLSSSFVIREEMAGGSFKQQSPLEKRQIESSRMRKKYPDRVPVGTTPPH